MRVTFVLPLFPRRPIGGFRVVYEYANGLAARGHDVAVVHARSLPQTGAGVLPAHRPLTVRARGRAERIADLLPWAGRRPRWHDVRHDVRMLFVPDLAAGRVPDADAVVATSWETAECVASYPGSKGEPFYLIQHHETWSGSAERVDATWRLPLHKIVIARWLLDRARSMGLTDVVHIPNAIDLGRFRVLRPIADRPARVAMAYSAGHTWKGSAIGFRALEAVRARVPDVEAVLFGIEAPPPGVPSWASVVRAPSQERIVEDIYNGSAVYLCPSFSEGWHLPPAEAMACGCAVVSTDIGGVHDYAEDRVTALLRPRGDASALADAVADLLADPALRERIASAGRRRIEGFSWAASVQRFEEHLVAKATP